MSTTEMNGGAVANGDASGVTGSHITERASNRATSLMSSVEVADSEGSTSPTGYVHKQPRK
jgi:hypothetical protein